jgi:hypothetical protein
LSWPLDRHNFREVVASRAPGDHNFPEVVTIKGELVDVVTIMGELVGGAWILGAEWRAVGSQAWPGS